MMSHRSISLGPVPAVLSLLPALVLLSGCPPKGTETEPPCSSCQLIRHVRVVDADGVREDRRVTISAGLITAEEPDSADPSFSGEQVDGTGLTLVPGLWDAHVHLMSSAGTNIRSSAHINEHLKSLLYEGVTSIIDLGSPPQTLFSLRERLERGEVLGPHLRTAGPFFTAPGGHPCPVDYDPETCALITTPESAETAMAALAQHYPDLVKVILDAGGAPFEDLPHLAPAQLAAVTQAAARHQLRVVAHVASAEEFAQALDAGVAAIAHVPTRDLLSEDLARRCAQQGVFVMTTLSIPDNVLRYVADTSFLETPELAATVPPAVLQSLRAPEFRRFLTEGEGRPIVDAASAFVATQAENLRRLRAAGVPLIAGSDAGNLAVFHGPGLLRELELLVQAGLTPQEALDTATLAPARLLGIEGRHGRVAPGYAADLVLVEGDPSLDISALRDVREVWLQGARLERPRLRVTEPDDVLRLRPSTIAPEGFCLTDSECQAGHACDRSRRCARTCTLADPSACPPESACIPGSATSSRGFCVLSDRCSPLAQDCPFHELYRTTCVPWEPDTTRCFPPSTAQEGAPCDVYNRNALCAQGLVCLDGRCAALCDPAGSSLPACAAGKQCVDQSARWGLAVGICQ
jgi:imidazolonepropionase-like amidohydrolase